MNLVGRHMTVETTYKTFAVYMLISGLKLGAQQIRGRLDQHNFENICELNPSNNTDR